MCRLIGWVSDEPTTMRALLGDAAVARLLHLSSVHCHGWGVAWHEAGEVGDELLVRHSQTQASEDPGFLDVLDSVSATSALVHLRLGTPGFDRLLTDTHPFCDGQWALAHNGAVAPGDRVDALLPSHDSPTPQGSTDSERWFLSLRHEQERSAAAEPAEHVAAAAATVVDRAAAAGLTCSSWNSLMLGPDALYVINLHDDAWAPGDIAVWPAEPPDADHSWPPYFDLRVRERAGDRLVVSSGVVDDIDGWAKLANGSVLRLGLDGGQTEPVRLPANGTARVSARADAGGGRR